MQQAENVLSTQKVLLKVLWKPRNKSEVRGKYIKRKIRSLENQKVVHKLGYE